MLTRQEARQIDRDAIEELKIPGIVLMENAGRGCAEILLQEMGLDFRSTSHPTPALSAGPSELAVRNGVIICCGPGNNGGDGLVIARHLYLAGIPVKIILMANSKQYRGDAGINWEIVRNLPIEVASFETVNGCNIVQQLASVDGVSTTWIVDAILGTGSIGRLRKSLVPWINGINQTDAARMAIDLPTGMDCDTGAVDPMAVIANVTCTFVDWKKGFANPDASYFLGRIEIVGIGCPRFSKALKKYEH